MGSSPRNHLPGNIPFPTTSCPWDPTSSLLAAGQEVEINLTSRAVVSCDRSSAQSGRRALLPTVRSPAGSPDQRMSLQSQWVKIAFRWLLVKNHRRWQSLKVRGRQVELCLPGGRLSRCMLREAAEVGASPHTLVSLGPQRNLQGGGRKAHKGQGGQCQESQPVPLTFFSFLHSKMFWVPDGSTLQTPLTLSPQEKHLAQRYPL